MHPHNRGKLGALNTRRAGAGAYQAKSEPATAKGVILTHNNRTDEIGEERVQRKGSLCLLAISSHLAFAATQQGFGDPYFGLEWLRTKTCSWEDVASTVQSCRASWIAQMGEQGKSGARRYIVTCKNLQSCLYDTYELVETGESQGGVRGSDLHFLVGLCISWYDMIHCSSLILTRLMIQDPCR